MTTQKSFKLRVRSRMEKTGERYAAARAALVPTNNTTRRRRWMAEPEVSDEAVHQATGKSWDDWCDLIDQWPGHTDGHTGIAAHVRHTHGVGDWWAQGVTVGYERITGLRMPYERPDGTFAANKSATIRVDAAEVRRMLLDDDERSHLFPGLTTSVKSRHSARAIRLAIGPSIAVISIESKLEGRTKVTIGHQKLSSSDQVEEWKFYWGEWLGALDQG